MGRFMQQDTLFGEMERPLTQNLYIYCLNNGVNLRDPSGNRSVDSIKSDVNRYKDQLASAKSSGAGQSVLDEIQKTIDSLIKELGNELSKPKPKPNPSTKPPKKPDWGDTSNPYNPVNNPNSAGSILSGADNYWSNGGNNGGGGYAPTQEDAMRDAEAKRKAEAEKKKISDSNGDGYYNFLKDMAFGESRNDYAIVNQFNYMGKYQVGYEALKDIGFVDYSVRRPKDADIIWSDKSKDFGVKSKADFLSNKNDIQEIVKVEIDIKNWIYLKSNGSTNYLNEIVSGVLITESGLLAGALSAGAGGVKKALTNNDLNSIRDGNNVPVKFYIEKFAGYNIDIITKGGAR